MLQVPVISKFPNLTLLYVDPGVVIPAPYQVRSNKFNIAASKNSS